MSDLSNRLSMYTPFALALLRIVAALLFLQHGTQKLFDIPPDGGAATELLSMLGAAAVIEIVGGVLILFGLFTRPVAFLLSGEMAVAYFIGHAPRSFFPAVNGGDAAILFCFLFLYLSASGPGALSLDKRRQA